MIQIKLGDAIINLAKQLQYKELQETYEWPTIVLLWHYIQKSMVVPRHVLNADALRIYNNAKDINIWALVSIYVKLFVWGSFITSLRAL